MAKDKDAQLTAAELTALRAFLRAAGVASSTAAATVKAAKTRRESAADVIAWLKGRPKK